MPANDPVDPEEVLRLDAEATPGPWVYELGSLHKCDDGTLEMEWIENRSYEKRKADGTAMAAFRTAAPALAREVIELRKLWAESAGILESLHCSVVWELAPELKAAIAKAVEANRAYLARVKGGNDAK